jgi:nitrate reductase NapE component
LEVAMEKRKVGRTAGSERGEGLTEYVIVVCLLIVASVFVVRGYGFCVKRGWIMMTRSLAGTVDQEGIRTMDPWRGGHGEPVATWMTETEVDFDTRDPLNHTTWVKDRGHTW